MKKIYSLLFMCVAISAFCVPNAPVVQPDTQKVDTLSKKANKPEHRRNKHKSFIQVADTLTRSDYMMSIEKVNDNLNDIRDSVKIGYDINDYSQALSAISGDYSRIRQDYRNRQSSTNLKTLFLYQNFAKDLDRNNDRMLFHINSLYNRLVHARYKVKHVLNDTLLHKLVTDSVLRVSFDKRLSRLERKWNRTDSTTRANLDTLNRLKMLAIDNSINLNNMLNALDSRLERADQKFFARDMNLIWQPDTICGDTLKGGVSVFRSENKAIGYYISQTRGHRILLVFMVVMLLVWLHNKRKILETINLHQEKFSFLKLRLLRQSPVVVIVLVIFSIMPFFDAYAPTIYVSVVYAILLLVSTIILRKIESNAFMFNWYALLILLLCSVCTYLFPVPVVVVRFWMLLLNLASVYFIYRFSRVKLALTKSTGWLRVNSMLTVFLLVTAAIANISGRVSLAGILALSALFCITYAVVLPLFMTAIAEILILQLVGRRIKKELTSPVDVSVVVRKIRIPLLVIAGFLWVVMLTSNLNLYHSLHDFTWSFLTQAREVGSISFRLTSVLLFVVIIWFSHVLQQLISFVFGETGYEADDMNAKSKVHHSRLLITRLLVLIGGYMLAIAASGLPVDKLTFLLGALGVGIGMGLQNVVNNFVSGIILIFDGSLKIGDEIEINGQAGKVKEIGLRASTLNTSDGAEVIIPNGNFLSQNIVNWTFSNDQKRVSVNFNLWGKELDANEISEIINQTLAGIAQISTHRKPVILFTRVTAGGCSLTVRYWTNISSADNSKSESLKLLNKAFAAHKIDFE